ncbi:DUF368 domain-containing protein [Thermodesulfobacteriota bacterium]
MESGYKRVGKNTGSGKSGRPTLSYLVLTVKGFCMGAADVVPGVSGGTMALILGIYEDLIGAIRSLDLKFLRSLFSLKIRKAMNDARWQFLLALGLGILMAIFSLAKALSWTLHNRPVLIWSFFFGLITASIFTVGRQLQKRDISMIKWFALGVIGTYLLVGMVPLSTPTAPWFLFLSGAIAICAMILPGISGAFILVLLGKYAYVLEAVNNRDFLTLFLLAAGAGVGLIAFSHFLGWLLRKYHDLTIALLCGLMLGSLRKIWPWKKALENIPDPEGKAVVIKQVNVLPPGWDGEFLLALGCVLLGFFIVLMLHFWAKRKEEAVPKEIR